MRVCSPRAEEARCEAPGAYRAELLAAMAEPDLGDDGLDYVG